MQPAQVFAVDGQLIEPPIDPFDRADIAREVEIMFAPVNATFDRIEERIKKVAQAALLVVALLFVMVYDHRCAAQQMRETNAAMAVRDGELSRPDSPQWST